MTKEEFLKRLKNKLSILEESEVIDILEEYSEHIDEKVKTGVSEKDAIKEFGDINELASDILSAYKVNKNYSEDKVETFIDDVINTVKDVFNKCVKVLSHGKGGDIAKLIIYIIVVLLIAALLKIPFGFLEDLLKLAFDALPLFLENIFDIIISVILNISYIIVAFIFIMKMMREKLLSHYVFEDDIEEEKKDDKEEKTTKSKTKNMNKKESVIKEKEVKERVIYRNQRTFLDSIGDLFLIIIKIFTAFILFPTIIVVVFAALGLIATILFAVKYYFMFGPIVLCLGILLGSIWLTELLFRFIAGKSGSFLKSFIMFIVALILCGAGMGISVIEFSDFRLEEYSNNTELLSTETFSTDSIRTLNCDECIAINKLIDNNITNDEVVVKVYGSEMLDINYLRDLSDENLKGVDVYISDSGVKTVNKILDHLKEGKIYFYERIDRDLTVELIGNEAALNKVYIEK